MGHGGKGEFGRYASSVLFRVNEGCLLPSVSQQFKEMSLRKILFAESVTKGPLFHPKKGLPGSKKTKKDSQGNCLRRRGTIDMAFANSFYDPCVGRNALTGTTAEMAPDSERNEFTTIVHHLRIPYRREYYGSLPAG